MHTQYAGRGLADQLKLDSGSDDSDMLSTSQSESSGDEEASNEDEAGSLEGKSEDVEMVTTSGSLAVISGTTNPGKLQYRNRLMS